MDTSSIILVALVAGAVVIVLAAVFMFMRSRKGSDLETRYGSEYERTVRQRGRKKGEAELTEREQRVSRYNLRALEPAERSQFSERWTAVQAEFVDAPRTALQHADVLLQEVMVARGYPIADFDQRVADLSVEYGDMVTTYRTAQTISQRANTASTEDLRRAILSYRAMFDRLLKVEEPATA